MERLLPQSCPRPTASAQSGFVEHVTPLVQQAAVEDSSSHQGRLGEETTFSLHVCADTLEKIALLSFYGCRRAPVPLFKDEYSIRR